MLNNKKQITYNRLRELLDYNPKTGVFVWKINRGNGVKIGDVARCKSHGYICIGVDGVLCLAHRLAWLYTHGYIPESDIDHINGVKDDNRIDNLREASRQCNIRNSKRFCTNTSGVGGVGWYKLLKKWRARVVVNNKDYHLGVFDDFDEAVCHRLAAEQCLGWSGCDSSSDAYRYVQKNIIRRNG